MKTKTLLAALALACALSCLNSTAQTVAAPMPFTASVVPPPATMTNLTAVPDLMPPAPPASITGGLGEILKATGLVTDPTNYAGAIFYGRSTSGNKNAVGVLVIENVNANLGVIAGVDTLWGGGKEGSANIVAGGLTLKEATHPLKFIGGNFATNFVMTPYAIAMVGTPIAGTGNADGGLASITRAGVNFDVWNFKGFELGAGADYGKRSGSGNYNGNWVDFTLNIRKGF